MRSPRARREARHPVEALTKFEAGPTAQAAGVRHFDTAAAYGNEAALGRALRASGLPRSELFVATKIDAKAL